MRTRLVVISSLVVISACSSADGGDSLKIDDEIVLAAPADTDMLPNDLPDTEVAAIVALGATGAKRPPAPSDHRPTSINTEACILRSQSVPPIKRFLMTRLP